MFTEKEDHSATSALPVSFKFLLLYVNYVIELLFYRCIIVQEYWIICCCCCCMYNGYFENEPENLDSEFF
jgi:hypothetical protein